MTIDKVSDIIYQYYPRGLSRLDPLYEYSSGHLKLTNAVDARIEDKSWLQIETDLKRINEFSSVRYDVVPVRPSCRFELTFRKTEGFHIVVYLFISFIGPYWTLYTRKQADGGPAADVLLNIYKEYDAILRTMAVEEAAEFINKIAMDKLGIDFSVDRRWGSFPNEGETSMASIQSILSKYDLIQFPIDRLFEIIPDVTAMTHVNIGESTYLDCFFIDTRNIL